MLKLPPPVWALVYVLFAVAISWPLGWPKMPGFPLPPLGIALLTVPWILPVWAIIMFRREGTEVSPTSPANRLPLMAIAFLSDLLWPCVASSGPDTWNLRFRFSEQSDFGF